jgi:NAD(P)H-hydrate repair Nnr-like enzyme with NAD(P)H-hydrate epimerase domain
MIEQKKRKSHHPRVCLFNGHGGGGGDVEVLSRLLKIKSGEPPPEFILANHAMDAGRIIFARWNFLVH